MGFGFYFLAELVKIDFLRTESERPTIIAKGKNVHSQHLGVKLTCWSDTLYGQYEMIKAVYFHGRTHGLNLPNLSRC